MTTLHTHKVVGFADPYLTCAGCGEWVTGWHNPQVCRCAAPAFNMPCQHQSGTTSMCPSWGPVDGCRCAAQLGHVPHGTPARIGGNMTGGGR